MKKHALLLLICVLCIVKNSTAQTNISPANTLNTFDQSNDGTVTGVIIIDTDELIFVTPNPAQNYILFNINTDGKKLIITNSSGIVVKSLSSFTQVVDVSDLANGTYYFTVIDATNNQKHGSFIIQR
ncbi:MAG: T9SS type A sorting domain-containing protein [Chitinophagales bacterium]|nr:T9SS type A sorting domain-containing protein [Chitinophagales bacterium]